MSDSAKQKCRNGTAQRGLDVLSTSQTAGLTLGAARPRLRTRKGPYYVDETQLGALQSRALREGGTLYSPWDDECPRTFWPIAGKGRDRCIKPVVVVLNNGEEGPPLVGGSALELHVRCRICEPCLKAKSAYWKLRAMAEIGRAPRTWFVTLTWETADLLRADYAAAQALRKAGVVSPSKKELFAARLKVLGPAVTRWLQRVRKGLRRNDEAQVSFRYLLVWEEHDSDATDPLRVGMPHAHLLIHEKAGQTVTKRRIQREWGAGFSSARLVDATDPEDIHRGAAYVCKYIAKSMLSRVRASTKYGLCPELRALSA